MKIDKQYPGYWKYVEYHLVGLQGFYFSYISFRRKKNATNANSAFNPESDVVLFVQDGET